MARPSGAEGGSAGLLRWFMWSRNPAASEVLDFYCEAPNDNLALQPQLRQTHVIFGTSYIGASGNMGRLNIEFACL